LQVIGGAATDVFSKESSRTETTIAGARMALLIHKRKVVSRECLDFESLYNSNQSSPLKVVPLIH
jgi:hypothetical protein